MIGQFISQFEILEELGRGGMGIVYKAHDRQLDRPVALKFLPPDQSGQKESTQRFLQEARAASALNHPNVITVYEIGKHDDRMYIATEFIEGKTLRELIPPQGLSVEFTLHCARQIVEGLRAAHARGIIHRDIKPENIMVTPDGRVKIMDFGLARNTGSEQITTSGLILGTALYMSPEQVDGRSVDLRTDIYSLGTVLYEMLSGKAPFSADYQVAILYAVVNTDPVPLEEVNANIPSELCRIVAQCLKKSPEERYQSCDEISRAIAGPEILSPESTRDASTQPPFEHIRLSVPPEAERSRTIVGQTEHLRSLQTAIGVLASGNGRTLFVRGESGIGKTHLVGAAAHDAWERGYNILWGRCPFQEAGLPYQPIAAAIKNSFSSSGHGILETISQLGRRQGINLGGRMSSIKSFLRLSADPAPLQNREQLWDAIFVLLTVLATDRPCVVVIDDMQWADKESIGLFSFIARNIADVPLLLIGIYRPGIGLLESGTNLSLLADMIRQLKIDGHAGEISLDRLSEAETAELLNQTLDAQGPGPQTVRQLFAVTAGNPLFTRELVNLMKESGQLTNVQGRWHLTTDVQSVRIPGRIQEVITRRLTQLTAEERELLEIASCDGNQFSSDVLVALPGTDRLSVLRKLQSLEKDHALIHHEKTNYRFDHPLIRQVLYDGILPELREEYHRLVAESLIARAENESTLASRIAFHLRASAQEQRAPEYLLKAAGYARSLYANDEAFELYSQARAILSKKDAGKSAMNIEVEEGLGDVAFATGKSSEAEGHYEEMLRMAALQSEPTWQVESRRKLSNTLRILGEIPRAAKLGEEALDLARTASLAALQVECLNTLAVLHFSRAEYERTIALSEEALSLSRRQADERNAAVSLSNIGLAYVHTGAYRLAVKRLDEAKSLQEFIGDRKGLGLTLNYLALANHRRALFEVALKYAHASVDIKQSISDAQTLPGAYNILGDIYRDIGDIRTALDYHSRSLKLAREQNNRGSQCDNLRDLGTDHLILGNYEESRRYLEEVLTLAKTHGYAWYETRSHITFAELHLALNNLPDAEASATRGVDLARNLNAQELIAEALWRKGLVQQRKGSPEAISTLREALSVAKSSEHEIFLWQLYRDLSAALHAAGQDAEAEKSYAEAVNLVRKIAEGYTDPDARASFIQWTKLAIDPPAP